MKNNKTLTVALAALFTSGMAMADMEVSGKIIIEHAATTSDGSTIGSDVVNTGFTAFKDEVKVQLIADGDVTDNTTFHVDVMGFANESATANYVGTQSDTQRDGFRELYVDTAGLGGGWDLRLGKQQVVWGTADGMKLLDAINPTDYSEMAQNQMEDSRITVWAANGEKTFANGSNVQLVISEAKPNFIPGLNNITSDVYDVTVTRNECGLVNGGVGVDCTPMVPGVALPGSVDTSETRATDQNHVFMMKGVDSISGASNGILNIVPQLAEVATTFGQLSAGFAGSNNNAGYHLQNWTYANVDQFVTNTGAGSGFGGACPYYGINTGMGATSPSSAFCLNSIAQDTNNNQTNLIDSSAMPTEGVTYAVGGTVTTAQGYAGDVTGDWDAETPDSAFEYMSEAAFSTFATFSSAKSKYVSQGPESQTNLALRYSDSTKSGLNYSLNFMRGADANPHIDLEWQNADGQTLDVQLQTDPSAYATGMTTVRLADAGGDWHTGDFQTPKYGYNGSGAGATAMPSITNPVTLVLNEKFADITQTGGSFDTSFETAAFGPVVLRGEALYQQGVRTPIIDKAQMSIGNITEAFTSLEGDRFKFVMGLDITVLTNMMISGQIIQDNNLDFVDSTSTVGTVTGDVYTADMATMAMDNQYNKAIKNKNFYSLFFSKPFGASGQNRWSNILMIEEGVGDNAHWNRFDVDFGISDDVVATVEVNTYGGNLNTQFGQMDQSDNMQVGVKYSF